VLADDDAALGHQSVGSFGLGGDVKPGVGVLNVHGALGTMERMPRKNAV
jgi:hypothetical protein